MSKDDFHILRGDRDPHHNALCGATPQADEAMVSGPPRLATCWRCIMLHMQRPLPQYPVTPEHERLEAAKKTDDATQLVGEFLEWLSSQKKIILATYHGDELWPANERPMKLLAEFFGVNENALESEKRALLAYTRQEHEAREWVKTTGIPFLRGE